MEVLVTPHSDHALVYVCIISNFNQPELEACLTRKPADILLIVSSSMAKSADRFVRVYYLANRSRDVVRERLLGCRLLGFRDFIHFQSRRD